MGKIRVRRSTNGQYYVRIDATNGEPLFTSETYVTKSSAQNAARLAQGGGGTIVDET